MKNHGIAFSATKEKTAMERNKRSSADNKVNGTMLHTDLVDPLTNAKLRKDNFSDFLQKNEGSDNENGLLSVNNNHQLDEDDDDEDDEDDLVLGDEDELGEDDEKVVADAEIDEDFDEEDLDEEDLLLDADDDEEEDDDL